VGVANNLATNGVHSRAKCPTKSTKTVQSKSPRGDVLKRPRNAAFHNDLNTCDRRTALSPRKHQRGSGKIGTLPMTSLQAVSVERPSGQSVSQKVSEPLSLYCRTVGENRSLPIGWCTSIHVGKQNISGNDSTSPHGFHYSGSDATDDNRRDYSTHSFPSSGRPHSKF
jgi:hypothetical protein